MVMAWAKALAGIAALSATALVVTVGLQLRRQSVTADNCQDAPFDAMYADLVLNVPRRSDLFQAVKCGRFFNTKICDRHVITTPVLCEALAPPLVGEFGVLTIVKQPRPGTRFKLLQERPSNLNSPEAKPMNAVSSNQIDSDLTSDGEAYELSRIWTISSKQLLTTDGNWPIAACDTHPLGTRYCTVGFLIRGAFVEAQWFAESGVTLDQAEVWNVATAVDAKLRALSVEMPRQ